MRPGIEAKFREAEQEQEREKGCQGLSGTVRTDMSMSWGWGKGEIFWEGPTQWGTGMAQTGSQELVMLNVQVFNKLVDIRMVAMVETFTPWKWTHATNQGFFSPQRASC